MKNPNYTPRMTWQQAMREAENLCGMILQQVEMMRAAGHPPDVIPLTSYPTQEDYDRIQGDNPGYTWRQHQMINQACQRILSRNKIKARRVEIHADDFIAWLQTTGKKNTQATRAEYAARAT